MRTLYTQKYTKYTSAADPARLVGPPAEPRNLLLAATDAE
jgi:hypothetical protein